MVNPTAPQVVRSYLAQLDRALADLPAEVRDEIAAGVREELYGLDAEAAAVRIETLGDPEFIAAEARAEDSGATALRGIPRVESSVPSGREPSWFPVLAVLTFAVGGLIIPLYGWILGLGLVWVSRSWSKREKLAGTVIGPVAAVVGALIAVSAALAEGTIGPQEMSGLSAIYNAVVDQLRLLLLVNGVVGIWLAWRVSRRWWREQT